MTRDEIIKLLPGRPEAMHKGDRGRLLVLGGSEHYPGAPALSVLSALRCGAGVVTLLSLPSVCAACAARLPEAVYRPVQDWGQGAGAAQGQGQKKAGAAVVGPGLERSEEAQDCVVTMWRRWEAPLLVDGDGLFALAMRQEGLPPRDDAILTPHEGEAARLLGTTARAVRWGCVLLKGHGTLVARRGDPAVLRLDWGGPELAVPGSGDVLSGCIGALSAAGLAPFDAAALGGALHGMAGERLAQGGVDGVLASEIAETLRAVLHDLRKGVAA